MRYMGIDLAWGERNTTAVVVLEGGYQGAEVVVVAEALTGDEEIVEFVAAQDTGDGLLVAIDAPTCVPNETGRRPCEAILSACLRRQEAGPHPANRGLLARADGTVRGERLVELLEALGVAHTPYWERLLAPPRACFEAFPHPAHVALFGLEKTLKYKAKLKRTKETRYTEFRRYAALLESLEVAEPFLRLSSVFPFREVGRLGAGALKRYEDSLDALTCAYIALYFHRWGTERCAIVGNVNEGYVVTPATPEMQRCFAEQAVVRSG